MDATLGIIQEIYAALETLHAPADLLAVIGSWRDSLSDSDVLDLLRDWNQRATIWNDVIVRGDED